MAGRETYRASGTTIAAIAATIGSLVFVLLAVVGQRGGRAAGVVIAVLLGLLAWRMWRVGIRADRDGVTIVTLFLSRRIPWRDVDHFAVLPLGRSPNVGHVVLRDGSKFGTFGLSTSARNTEKNRLQIQRSVDALNQVLAERREQARLSE